MKYAIIAAGEGSRLMSEGVALPKPLVPICGEPMIDRLVRIFTENGADEICIIVNRLHPQTEAHVRHLMAQPGHAPIRLAVETTPSSMHSFNVLAPWLEDAPFCLTTVDTIFREDDFARYIAAFEADTASDGMMAVTPFIEDEKPLYVDVDNDMNIRAFRDAAYEGARFISGGVYALNDKAITVLEDCMSRGIARMRNFQRALIDAGLGLKAYPIEKIVDVDHAGDIEVAERFLRGE